eukprot:3510386-Lingulodinium_polyedra.AAC.1
MRLGRAASPRQPPKVAALPTAYQQLFQVLHGRELTRAVRKAPENPAPPSRIIQHTCPVSVAL